MKNILYINAGAGSGKTYSLTERFADLIERGETTPSRVILTTFTERAAAEFRLKAREKLIERGLHPQVAELDSALIGTVHSVAMRYIMRYWYLLGLGAGVKPMPLLKDFGLAEDCVAFLEAKNTEEEAKGIAELLGRVDFQRRVAESQSASKPKILLVTSAWHMKRARLMFGKYAPGIEVVCAPADFEQTMMAENMFSFKAVVPDVMAFQFNCFAFREWVGIVGYKLFR